MAACRTTLLLTVAAATLLVGLFKAVSADDQGAGVGRSQSYELDAAALEKSVDVEADADDDGSHDGAWHSFGLTVPSPAKASSGRLTLAQADAAPLPPLLATSSVRGPPGRG